jgi:hypothetical protein
MKRHFVLVAVLALLLLPVLNPSPYSMPLAIGIESHEKPFFAAADGDESSDSITSFSETTADDVLFYPDLFYIDTIELADTGQFFDEDYSSGTYVDTHTDGDNDWYAGDNTAAEYDVWMDLNFTLPIGAFEVRGFDYYIDYNIAFASGTGNLQFYNWTSGAFDTIKTLACIANPDQHDSGTHYELDYISGTDFIIRLDSGSHASSGLVRWDYAYVKWYVMHLADSGHYAESFAGVGDWITSDCSMTTDGDVATITENGAGSWGRAYASFSATDYQNYYYEFRSTIESGATIKLQGYDGAAWFDIKGSTSSSGTLKGIISSAQAATLERVAFQISGNGKYVKPDYLRIGNSTSMGWQHDCSTIAGVTDDGDADFAYTKEVLNSDTLNCSVITSAGTAQWADIMFAYDTTTTVSDLERDYYQFVEFRWRCTSYVAGTDALYVSINVDGKRLAPAGGYRTSTFDWVTERYNMKAATTDTSQKYVDFIVYTNAVGEGAVFEIDYIRFYSIANFTIGHGTNTVNDYLYVDSGVLHTVASNDWASYFSLQLDPIAPSGPLSFSGSTYNVVNITGTCEDWDKDRMRMYSSGWTDYFTGSRFAHGKTGTIVNFQWKLYCDSSYSAIKFIEDGTAPDVIDKFVNPVDPYDDESVTFTAVTYDAIEVYEVTLNAVVYPVGFNDVDYDLTEQTDDVLWSYEFSTLISGYYLFQVTASDGANTYSEYIPVTVRESEITVDAISFFGVGEDFSTMTFSFDINKACSYVINEASENVGASDTHSGSVSEGMQNIAWTKLTTDDALVNFTITFTNASLTYAIEGQYQVAQVALAVSSYDWGFSETQVTISFQTSKGGTYTVYLDDVQDSTDSFVTGSTFLNWTRTSAEDPAEIQAAVLLTDGTTTIWLNQTYSEYGLTAETALIINTLIFDRSEANITAFVTSNWLNCTTTLYENEVQKDTGSEGTTLTYVKSTTVGTYNVALKIDGGGSVLWYNSTYTIAADEITIDTYTFFGTSSDFSYMQYSGQISHDCTYNISEWSSSWAKNETHTGSVTAGLFNIAWDKIGVNDVDANFTIVFVNGSLSLTIEGYYGTAYKLLRITEIDVHNLEESRSLTNLTVNFHTNKDIDWCVYDVDDNDAVLASGSSLEGSGNLTWVKNRIPHAHFYAVKWTDGVSNIWYNNSYWTYRENMDSLDQPGKDWEAADARKTIEFWTTVTALIVIGAIIAIGISHYNLSSKIKALQIPHYETQERNGK